MMRRKRDKKWNKLFKIGKYPIHFVLCSLLVGLIVLVNGFDLSNGGNLGGSGPTTKFKLTPYNELTAHYQRILTPTDLINIFKISGEQRSADFGSGETIALLEVDTYFDNSAFQGFCRRYRTQDPSIWQPGNQVLTAGTTPRQSHMTAEEHAAEIPETMLDVEWAHVVAPKARLIIVGIYGQSKSSLDTILTTHHVSVVSNSHAGQYLGIRHWPSSNTSQYILWAAKNYPVFTASGDAGSVLEKWANIPQVVFVGGTQLNPREKTFSIRNSQTWVDEGYGHGVFQIPALPYQRSIAGLWRRTPDVVWLAGYPGVTLQVHDGKWMAGNGTSLATPLWAAMWALGDKAHKMKTGVALSPNANEVLYELHSQNSSAFLNVSGARPHGLGMPSPVFVRDIGTFNNRIIKSYKDQYPARLSNTLRVILFGLFFISFLLLWRAIKRNRYKVVSWFLAYLVVAFIVGPWDLQLDTEWFSIPVESGNLPLRLLSLILVMIMAFVMLLVLRSSIIRMSHKCHRKFRRSAKARCRQKQAHI